MVSLLLVCLLLEILLFSMLLSQWDLLSKGIWASVGVLLSIDVKFKGIEDLEAATFLQRIFLLLIQAWSMVVMEV